MDEILGGKRIFFWSADGSGCAYYRCELPAAELARHGHETHVADRMPDEWLRTADVIVGQRVCQPGATIRWQQLAREGRCALVFECGRAAGPAGSVPTLRVPVARGRPVLRQRGRRARRRLGIGW